MQAGQFVFCTKQLSKVELYGNVKYVGIYSKSSNSVNICSKNTSRYLKSHCLNLYYDVCEKSRYIEESRYFTYKIEYFGTKKLIAL